MILDLGFQPALSPVPMVSMKSIKLVIAARFIMPTLPASTMNPHGLFFLSSVVLLSCAPLAGAAEPITRKPNILFIAIDDQNDWIGPLGGHPLAKTPQLDRLAARGTTFLNAHCQSPLCNPSRTSLLLGLRPTTTGIYGLSPQPRALAELRGRVSLPQHFAAHGYRTAATGKIYHGGTAAGGNTKTGDAPEFQVTAPYGGVGAKPPKKLIAPTPMGNHPLMDWGVWPPDNDDTKKGDYQVATWTVEQIKAASKDQPFFLAAGFFLPHVPCYATQKWFDLYPDDDSVLPKIIDNDRADTPRFSWYLHWQLPEPRLKWIKDNHQWRNLVRSYLACTSFVDAQIGRLLTALEESGQAENTIVVVWGDNGFHLGEKEITGKNTLWGNSTRVPLIFAGPGVQPGQRCTQPAELLDIYPTLIALAGAPRRDDLEGLSLIPQLRDAATPRQRPAITSHNQGNHGVRSERWRYIRYADHSEELYDMQADPHEWHNLAANPKYAGILNEHKKWLPQVDRPPAPGSAQRVLTYDKATTEAVWEGTPIKRGDPVPE
jgi:choline-sulfatase